MNNGIRFSLAFVVTLCLPMLGVCGTEPVQVTSHLEPLRVMSWAVTTFSVMSLLWAVVVLWMDCSRKRCLKRQTLPENLKERSVCGLPERMTVEDVNRVEARLSFLEGRLNDDGWFTTRTDLLLACEALAECRAILPTEPSLIERMNELSDTARMGLSRRYVLWNFTFGKIVLVGGAIVSGLLCIYLPVLLPVTLIPLLLYSVLGLTPHVVAINPGGVDGVISGLVLATCAGALSTAGEIGSYRETAWFDTTTGQKVQSEVDFSPTAMAILVTILVLILVAICLFVRMEILFVRNFMVYR